MTDWLTAILQPQLQRVEIAAPVDATRFGLGYTDLGARARLWTGDGGVLSAQVVGRIPGPGDDADPARIGHTDPELDLRLLLGQGFAIGDWPSFVDAQAAYRLRTGDPADEIRADLTFGTRPHPRLLLLAQSFNVVAAGTADGIFKRGRYSKLQLSGVWSLDEA